MLHTPAVRYSLAFAVPGFVVAVGILAATWLVSPELLPLQGRGWADATYPLTAAVASALVARAAFRTAGGKVRSRIASALIGSTIALLAYYLVCVHAGAALLSRKGHDPWSLDALGAGFWAYMFWSFVGLWGLGVPLLGAAIGWRMHPVLATRSGSG